MIRFAKKEDINNIIALWNKSFTEEESFTKWYFENVFDYENTLVYEKDGAIYSALQRLAYEINNIGKVTYIYGACTHPDYRNQGLMSELIKYSEKLDRENGIKASILIPQKESLFKFYEQFGYKPKFKLFNKIYKKENPKDHSYTFSKCKEDELYSLNLLYEKTLEKSNYVIRNENYWKEQFKMFNDLNGNVFCLKFEDTVVGYAFVWNDKKIIAQELVGLNSQIKKILCHEIMEYYNSDTVDVFSFKGNVSEFDFGCIKEYEKSENNYSFFMNLMYN